MFGVFPDLILVKMSESMGKFAVEIVNVSGVLTRPHMTVVGKIVVSQQWESVWLNPRCSSPWLSPWRRSLWLLVLGS